MTSMNYNHGLLPRLLVSGWLEIGEREEGGAGLLIPAPHLKGFSLWLSWVLVITSSLCPLRPHCFLLHHYFWWFPFTCREDSSDHWPNSPLSVLGSRCLLKCWRLSVISWLNGCALTSYFPFRSKSWRLAAHVLASATNHHPGTLCLFCHFSGTKVHGESKALWTQESDDNIQFFHSTLFYVYMLWGKCLKYS